MTVSRFDLLVVGSGPSGAQAAAAAVRRGASVGLVDVGYTDDVYGSLIPDAPFEDLRRSDRSQRRYFLGDRLEGVPEGDVRVGAQLTPPRQHITRDAEIHLPIESETFRPMQSLALGGLGAGWGAGCVSYESSELRRVGLPPEAIRRYYREVARDIGVSGTTGDDVSPHVAEIDPLQPPLELDSNAESILSSYLAVRKRFAARGMTMGRIPLAVLSEPLGRRSANPYHDMDFYGESRESVYRPKYTLRDLAAEPNFRYVNRTLIERFEELERGRVRVHGVNVEGGEPVVFEAKRLLLAAGALNTGRIVLRSLGRFGVRIPILCNPYAYIPTLNLRMLGRPARDRRFSLAQLTAILVPPGAPEHQVSAQFFSYRSLLLFKLVKEMPLPPALGLLLARLIVNGLVIVGVHHPDEPSPDRWLELRRDAEGRDRLHAHYARSEDERRLQRRHESLLLRSLLDLRCIPIGIVRPGNASSIHYAGTIPFDDAGRPLGCDDRGRLNGTRGVFLADGSSWRFLPAKGLTFTLMANARRVADLAADDLREAER